MDNPQDKISKLLADPENIKTLARIAAGIMPSEDSASSEAAGEKANGNADEPSDGKEAHTDSIPASASVSESDISGGLLGGIFADTLTPEKVDRGIGFLGALKPYLGSHKKEICEIMIKLLGAAKLLTIYKN